MKWPDCQPHPTPAEYFQNHNWTAGGGVKKLMTSTPHSLLMSATDFPADKLASLDTLEYFFIY